MPKLFLFAPLAALCMTLLLPACSGTEDQETKEPIPCDVDAGPACPSGYACYTRSRTATAGSCITDQEAERLTCGGIASLPCADGYACQGIDNVPEGTGQCVPLPR